MMSFNNTKIYYTLRFASAMCFIGHGAFGIITKQIWCNYFAVFGIGHDMAYQLMPVLGFVDILLGISLLTYPTRGVLLWLVIWSSITALLRPLSGEPFAEAIERAGNYGVPLVLLIMCGLDIKNVKGLFTYASPESIYSQGILNEVITCLKVVVFLLFLGHGWLNLLEKKGLITQYSALQISTPFQTAHLIGIFEIASAVVVLIRPVRHFLLFLFIWKMTSELFYPHWEAIEWIERGGSYGAILALWFALPQTTSTTRNLKTLYNY